MTVLHVKLFLCEGCEHGWVAGDGVCYRLSDDLAMFDVAKESCEEMGAHLVTVENQQESDFITNWLMTASSWCLLIFFFLNMINNLHDCLACLNNYIDTALGLYLLEYLR